MKFGQPVLSTELSGALNGVVGSTARGGIGYFRVRKRPGNPRTYGQTVVRSILSGAAAVWRSTLTLTERANWTAIAKTGESGIDRFTAANVILQQAGSARQDTAPTTADLAWLAIPTAPQFVISGGGGSYAASLNAAGNTFGANGERISFYIQDRPQPPSRGFPVGNPRFAGSFTIAGTAIPTIDINAFAAAAGIVAGKSVYMGAVKFKTSGEVSQRVTNKVLVS